MIATVQGVLYAAFSDPVRGGGSSAQLLSSRLHKLIATFMNVSSTPLLKPTLFRSIFKILREAGLIRSVVSDGESNLKECVRVRRDRLAKFGEMVWGDTGRLSRRSIQDTDSEEAAPKRSAARRTGTLALRRS